MNVTDSDAVAASDVCLQKGRQAMASGALDEALAAFEAARQLQPNRLAIVIDMLEILSRQRRLEEMETLIAAALAQFPGNVSILIYQGFTAIRLRQFERAAALWAPLYEARPHDIQILTGYAEALAALRDEARLLPVLDQLLALQPGNSVASILYARYEMRHNRAADAVVRLTDALAKHPQNKNLLAILADARMQALVTAPEEIPPALPPVAPQRNAPLLAHFESLGSGCEFGLLQRQFSVAPLGLLCWGSIGAAGLAAMLEQRFEGIGDAEQNVLRPAGQSYELLNHRYDFGMQTFISLDMEPAETLLPKLCKRQSFLARKLTEDLTAAERIMVYKAAEGITPEETQRLWRAVRSYGDNALLVVVLADEDLAAGQLKVIEDGLMMGALGHFSNADSAVTDWLLVCSEALSLWRTSCAFRQSLAAANSWR